MGSGGSEEIIIHSSIGCKASKNCFSIARRQLSCQIHICGGPTSAHVTTKPEKNIFGSGEKLLGLIINSRLWCGSILLQNRASRGNLNPSWLVNINAFHKGTDTVIIANVSCLTASCWPGKSILLVKTCVIFPH